MGIQEGVDYDSTMRPIRGLRNDTYNLKCTLEAIVSAGCWPAERINSTHHNYSPLCPRCGEAPESSLHCFWTCPANSGIEDPAVQETQRLVEAASTRSTLHPCLWRRGILAATFTHIDRDNQPTETVYLHILTTLLIGVMEYTTGMPQGGNLHLSPHSADVVVAWSK